MRENTTEKSMVKYKPNFWKKIKNFMNKILKKDVLEETVIENVYEGKNLKSELRKENEDREKILELQKAFEKGLISEDEMSLEDKTKIKDLYDEQIEELDIKIREKQAELNQKIEIVNKYYKMAIDLKLNKA